jgi:hypothetical protein
MSFIKFKEETILLKQYKKVMFFITEQGVQKKD